MKSESGYSLAIANQPFEVGSKGGKVKLNMLFCFVVLI